MPKLVYEYVVRESIIGSDSTVKIEDAAATVRTTINNHFDKLVRRELRGSSQRAIVERQHISFRSERVVRGADRRVAIDSGRGSRDPRLGCRRTQAPHVEAPSILFKRRRRE